MKLLDKDVLVAEIERRIERYSKLQGNGATEVSRIFGMLVEELTEFLSFVNTLEVKEGDLEKEIQRQYNVHKNPDNSIVKDCVIMTKDGFEYFAKYFYSLGLKVRKGEEE